MRILYKALFAFIFLCLLRPLPCPAQDGLAKDQVLESGGIARTYDLYVPPDGAAGPRPLVLILHTGTGAARN